MLFGLSLAYLAAYQLFKLPPCLPELLDRYGYDRTLAGSFMSVYAVAGLSLSIPISRLLEKRGMSLLLLLSLTVMLLGNILGLATPESGVIMLIARGLEGAAFAGMAIIGPVLANRNASPRHLPLIVSFTAIWIPVGQTVTILLAPWLLTGYGWPSMWYAGIAGVFILGGWRYLLGHDGLLSRESAYPESLHANRTDRISEAEKRGLIIAALIFMFWSAQYFAYMTWLPQYMIEALGLTLQQSITGYALPILVLLCVNICTGFVIRSGVSVGILLPSGLGLQAMGWWMLPLADHGPTGIISLVLYGIAAGIIPTCLFAMPGVILKRRDNTASAFGIIMTGRNLGVLVGPVLLARLIAQTGAWSWASPVFAVLTTMAFMLSISFARNRVRGEN